MSSETAADTETSRLCDFCRHAREDVKDVTITDESGGGSAKICASCRGLAGSVRCGLCGAVKSEFAKAEHLVWKQGHTSAEICDDCRDRMLFGRGDAL